MKNFPEGLGAIKTLSFISDPSIIVVGYHDLRFIKPQQNFWTQSHYTVHFVISGSGFLKIGGQTYHIKAGEVFVIPPDEVMMYYPANDDIWSYIWFSVSGEKAAEIFKETGSEVTPPVIIPENSEYIFSVLTGLFVNGKFADEFRIISVFYEFMHCISKHHNSSTDYIKSTIDSNMLDPDFTIEKLCTCCGLSHAQLCRIFKGKYGLTAKRYLIERRIEYAKHLLISTNLSIDAVALLSGYSDHIHFMKEFKRHVGMTAGKYRKNSIKAKRSCPE